MIAALTLSAIYVILFVAALRQPSRHSMTRNFLLALCAYSAVLMGVHGLLLGGMIALPQPLTNSLVVLIGFALSTGLVSLLTLAYLRFKQRTLTLVAVLTALWGGGLVLAKLNGTHPLIGEQPWVVQALGYAIPLATELAVLGWLIATGALLVLSWRAFLRESLPLYANRMLFWAVVLPLLLCGDMLVALWRFPASYVGYALRLIGAAGLVYGVVSHRVVDLRSLMRWMLSRAVLVLATGGIIFGAMMLAFSLLSPALPPLDRAVAGAVIALVVAVLLLPIMRLLRWLLRNLINRDPAEAAEIVRRYSENINGVIELTDLAETAASTINQQFGARRSSLILATHVDDRIVLQKIGAPEGDAALYGALSPEGPICRHFVTSHRPLLQYDIDYHSMFFDTPDEERSYFARQEMDIYAPIVDGDQLLGLLAVGPKANDDPFHSPEFDLLEALCSQTVAALKNARLVNDLRTLNERITMLNEGLRATNERLQVLDSVKTDFIAIASHELRTPLTQIQGYADLLREMSDRHLLDPDEALSITKSLSEATQRMTEVITSMLDVSQIDVEAMELHFVETTLSSIVKLAIEPYAEAIHERKQSLTARGLRNLPPIKGDFKRLVQAFQNLVTNAIKFTPDGGKIDIEAQVFETDDQGKPVSVQVIITDSGIGISKEHHQLIFEKFFRVGPTALHSSGKTKFKGAGPGLGLPIARGIIEAHGGQIWVESDKQDESTLPGSTFYVVLPINPPAVEAQKRLRQVQDAQDTTVVRLGAAAGAPGETAPPPDGSHPA